GSITFTLTYNGAPVAAATQTDTVTQNGTYGASFTLPTSGTVAGTYVWHAVYTSGNGNNLTAQDNGQNETTVVSPASPKVVTTPTPTSGTTGVTTLKDSAALSGGYFPTGSIVFTLIAPDGTTVLDKETVTVNGNGTYTTPVGYALPASAAAGT